MNTSQEKQDADPRRHCVVTRFKTSCVFTRRETAAPRDASGAEAAGRREAADAGKAGRAPRSGTTRDAGLRTLYFAF